MKENTRWSGKARLLLSFLLLVFAVIITLCLIYSPLSSKASPTSVTWTTKGDFENNAVTTGTPTTRTDVKVTGTNPSDNADIKLKDSYFHVFSEVDVDNQYGKSVGVNNNTNQIYVGARNYLEVIDGLTNKHTSSISSWSLTNPIHTDIYGVDVDETSNKIYATLYQANKVIIYNETTQVKTGISVGSSPLGVVADPGKNKVYVANVDSDTISVIDTTTDTVSDTITVGDGPREIDVNTANNRIYVANWTGQTVSAINRDNYSDITTIPTVEAYDVAVNPQTNKIYASEYIGKYVNVIDGGSNTVTNTISGVICTNVPKHLAVDISNNKIHVGNFPWGGSVDQISQIRGDTDTIEKSVWATDPGGMDFNSATNTVHNEPMNRLYAIRSNTDYVYNIGDAYPKQGTVSGLKIDAGEKVSWKGISWNATLPTNTSIEFRVKEAETEEGLASATWSYLISVSGTDLSHWVLNSNWLEVETRLKSSDGFETPTLHDFTVTYEPISLVERGCSNCHPTYPADSFENYLEENNIVYGSCGGGLSGVGTKCHYGQHRAEQDKNPYGNFWFKTETPFDTPPGELHEKHLNNAPLPAGCVNCHRTTDCSVCHRSNPPHGTHGSVGPVSITVCNGTNTYSKGLTCGGGDPQNNDCHNIQFNEGTKGGTLELAPLCGTCHPGVKKSGHTPHGGYSTFTNLCAFCHQVHGAEGKKITKQSPEIEICYACHDGSGSSYDIRSDFEHVEGVKEGSAHDTYLDGPVDNNIECIECHHPHGATAYPGGGAKMTKASEENLCYQCHNDPANSENNINIYQQFTASTDPLYHHDITDAEQTVSGSTVECNSCHNPHINNRTNKVVDPEDTNSAWTGTNVDFCGVCHTTPIPTPRYWMELAYDSQSDKTIMFGGEDVFGGLCNDTHSYDTDSGAWASMNTKDAPGIPSARYSHSMVYDGANDRMVMFGGAEDAGGGVKWYLNDTWTYDYNLNTWQEKIADRQPDSPPPKGGHAMAYDSQSSKVILFGGTVGDSSTDVPNDRTSSNDTWAYDLATNTWEQMNVNGAPGVPPARKHHTMVYDSTNDRVVLFGGEYFEGLSRKFLNDTWVYDYNTNTWTMKNANEAPGIPVKRAYHAMAYDSESGRTVLYGGWPLYGDTWIYETGLDSEPGTWTQMSPLISPPPERYRHSLTYDSLSDQVVLFGGYMRIPELENRFGGNNDTWVYDTNINTWTMNNDRTAVIQPVYTYFPTQYANYHGSRAGLGFYGTLRPPYSRGMDAVPCVDCHDPHGSSNIYHIKETVNGYPVTFSETAAKSLCDACHVNYLWPDDNHTAYTEDRCLGCHRHVPAYGNCW